MKKLSENFWFKYFKVYDVLNELIPYKKTLDYITSKIKGEDLHVLDLGCGTGNLSYSILMSGKASKVVGLDFSKPALDIAYSKNNKNYNVVFKHHNLIDKLPYKDQTFNVVVMNNVLYTIDIKNRKKLIEEIYRVLKKDGQVLISSININFKPVKIYLDHIKISLKKYGFLKTFFQVIKFIKPTILIFYYNILIKKENNAGDYSFINRGEQRNLLQEVGFRNVCKDLEVYSSNAFLNIAVK